MFTKEEVNYIGHMIFKEGVNVCHEKIKAILKWLKPTNVSKLRGFLGLTRYCQTFIQNYAHIIAPLLNISKRNSFQWNEEAGRCFEALKKSCLQHTYWHHQIF